jgi:Arc/MetJ family transcription regulator
MRTNIVLDDRLVKEVMRLSKARTKREAVDLAMREFVSRGKQRDVLAMIGAGLISEDYDVRAIRERAARDSG